MTPRIVLALALLACDKTEPATTSAAATAGLAKANVEDPNAPGPPSDAKPIGVAELRAGAITGRTKWSGASVTAKGLYMSATTLQTSGGERANVSITAAKADLKNVITCVVDDPKSLPPKLAQYDAVTVKGKVRVREMISGDSDKMLDVELEGCSVEK
ncbi:MAG TPA: hypothetical protein VGH87_29130 [Polyangiaceae bacterium]